jgi:hypothetical protein
MYRAIKYTDGGEAVEFRHFNTLNAAYTWLVPANAVQQEERWHIKLLPPLMRAFETVMNRAGRMEGHVEVVGWNEMEEETTVYIQTVEAWDDALPNF